MASTPFAATAGSIADRFDKLAVLRLVQAAERFCEESPRLADDSGFGAVWSAARAIGAEGLVRACRQPLLHAWVTSAETLLKHGLHERYPEAHPARHLKAFSRVALCWAAHLPAGATGRFSLGGRLAVQLAYGDGILVHRPRTTDVLTWSVGPDTLTIRNPTGEIVLDAARDLADVRRVGSSWTLLATPRAGRLLVDAWTPEYQRGVDRSASADSIVEDVGRVVSGLEPDVRAWIEETCRTVAPDDAAAPWVAGLVRCPEPGLDRTRLIALASRDLVERLLALAGLDRFTGPQSSGSDFHSAFVDLAADRLARRAGGVGPTRDEGERDARWRTMCDVLRGIETGAAILDALGEEAPATLAPAGPSTGGDVLVLRLPAGVSVDGSDELALRKTRRGSAFTVDDLSAIDAVGKMPRADLDRLWLALCAGEAPRGEADAFLVGIAAYVLGRFEHSAGAFLRCLEHDADVEEHWHLLAWTLRHLRKDDEFDAIMFGGRRDLAALAPLRPYTALLERLSDALSEHLANDAR